jgi:methylenetetrahydrofolate reductase (NADPH)
MNAFEQVAGDCPKSMTYGPCGGVTPAGDCEVPGLRCPFVHRPVARWSGAADPGIGSLERALGVPAAQPVVIADLPAVALDVESLRRTAGIVAGTADAVLLGDHGQARVQLPPALRAHLVQAEGVRAWAGLNCRDRNRVALESELAGLAAVGAAGVHCVTGDHTSLGHRPDAAPVFDLDSTRLVAAAAAAGLTASVGENPVAPPTVQRPARLAQKVAAGARVCFINHTSGPAAVQRFVEAALEASAGPKPEFIACVAVVTDHASAGLLRSFTGLELPPGYLEGILGADDVQAAGIRAATDLATSLLAVPGIRGVNLSGGARPGDEVRVATTMAQIARSIRP